MQAHDLKVVKVMPSRKKQLWLLVPVIALLALIIFTTTFMSVLFLVYTAAVIYGLINLITRIFSNKPLLILTPQGMLSNMTINGKNAGLVSWGDIVNITATSWLGIKNIDVYTKSSGERFFLQLGSDEAEITHQQLLEIVTKYWNHYRHTAG